MRRQVLVTGGAGFVGSHLVDRLVSGGDDVTVIDDLSRGNHAWLAESVDLHQVDIRDEGAVRKVVAAVVPHAVVHLAAVHFIPEVEGAPALAREVNVEGTRILLSALSDLPPSVLLFASTGAVYPDRPGPIDEQCPPSPLDLYGETKYAGERLVADFATRTATRSIVARIFNVVGRRETNPHVVSELVEQLRRGQEAVRLGNLDSRRDYTDVVDVSAALHRLLSVQRGVDVFNVGSGRSVSVAELVATCEDVLGRRIDIRVDPGKVREHDRSELVADARLLRETTGWHPERSLAETLSDLLGA